MAEGNVGWTMNARGVIVYQTNGQPVLIPHDDFKLVVADWQKKFPEENPSNVPQERLSGMANLDQEMAKFRDLLKKFARRLLDDPECLTLTAKIIQLVNEK